MSRSSSLPHNGLSDRFSNNLTDVNLRFSIRTYKRVKPFANFLPIANAIASLVLIPRAMGAQPSGINSLSTEDTAIQPQSIVSGYPVAPTYTLLRYDDDYTYLPNPPTPPDPLHLITRLPLFHSWR